MSEAPPGNPRSSTQQKLLHGDFRQPFLGEWTSALSNLLSFCRLDEEVKFEATKRGCVTGNARNGDEQQGIIPQIPTVSV